MSCGLTGPSGPGGGGDPKPRATQWLRVWALSWSVLGSDSGSVTAALDKDLEQGVYLGRDPGSARKDLGSGTERRWEPGRCTGTLGSSLLGASGRRGAGVSIRHKSSVGGWGPPLQMLAPGPLCLP